MRTPRERVIRGGTHNWRTYAMRGKWLRAGAGLVERDVARAFIEESWLDAE